MKEIIMIEWIINEMSIKPWTDSPFGVIVLVIVILLIGWALNEIVKYY